VRGGKLDGWEQNVSALNPLIWSLLTSSCPRREASSLFGLSAKGSPNFPLIVMSGVADPAHHAGVAESMGAKGALSKPFTRHELLDAVNESVGSRGRSRASSRYRSGVVRQILIPQFVLFSAANQSVESGVTMMVKSKSSHFPKRD